MRFVKSANADCEPEGEQIAWVQSTRHDAEFIAAAPQLVRDLLALVDALTQRLSAYETTRHSICRYCGEDIRQEAHGWIDRETHTTCEGFEDSDGRHHLPVAPDLEAELIDASRARRTLEADLAASRASLKAHRGPVADVMATWSEVGGTQTQTIGSGFVMSIHTY